MINPPPVDLDELENALALVACFGPFGLLCECEPFYPDRWNPSDSEVLYTWEALEEVTEVRWQKR